MLKPAIFLDRDGVLNKTLVQNAKPYAPRQLQDFHIFPAGIKITRLLKEAGFLIVVVTNQPDVGNGIVKQAIVEGMHYQLSQTLTLDAIKVCYHSQSEGCLCRKPKPGMLLEASQELGIDLKQSIMVGDRSSDILAGIAAGCRRTILIDYGYSEPQLGKADVIVRSLEEVADAILGH